LIINAVSSKLLLFGLTIDAAQLMLLGMTYNEIRSIFEKHYNLNQAFLERVEEEVIGQKEEGNKRKGDSLNQDVAKKQRIDEKTEELKTHLQIIANDDDDDVYTEATPLALKDKGKGILIKEPKPLKRQAHIEQDEAFARQLEAELNANINWNDVMEQVKRKEKQDNTMDFFKGMTYNEIRSIFEKHYNLNQAFLERVEEEVIDVFSPTSATPMTFHSLFQLQVLHCSTFVPGRLEKKRQFKFSGLKRLRKVGTTQRVESSADTVMDDQEDASKQEGGGNC
nr:hypothetical protein [Tanacetum cinerariifolium]